MAVASKELRGVNGDVVVESNTPHIVCAEELLALKETDVKLEVTCKQQG